jgi:amidase
MTMHNNRAGSLVHLLARDLTTALDRQLAPLGVTTQQAALLGLAGTGVRPSELMEALGTDTAGMTRLLDRLEAKGLITRAPNPADRRSVIIEPTAAGFQLIPKLHPVVAQVNNQIFEGFTDGEIDTLTQNLRRMRENLQTLQSVVQVFPGELQRKGLADVDGMEIHATDREVFPDVVVGLNAAVERDIRAAEVELGALRQQHVQVVVDPVAGVLAGVHALDRCPQVVRKVPLDHLVARLGRLAPHDPAVHDLDAHADVLGHRLVHIDRDLRQVLDLPQPRQVKSLGHILSLLKRDRRHAVDNLGILVASDAHLREPRPMSTWLEQWESGGDGPRLAVKDCIDVAGSVTSVGCEAIAARAVKASKDAEVVVKAKMNGARLVGKTNLTELCWSAVGTNTHFGTPVNPLAPGRVPGGSSSGSAVAIANGEADVAFGTDTGGSVRVPAACCGVTGLKTTWGRIPTTGVYPLAPSLDTVGWLGADIGAIETGMRLIEPGFTARDVSPRAGRLRTPGVAPEVDAAIDQALARTEISLTEASTPGFEAAYEAAGVIIDSEGYRSNEWLLADAGRLEPHNQANMRNGAKFTPDEIKRAQRVKDNLRRAFDELLKEHRFLITPVLSGPPPVLGQRGGIRLTLLTAPVNLAGLPALALPLHGQGYPMALQVIGPAGSEEELLGFGAIAERATIAG